ncbi:hypothetical protein CgunFtcFv8_015638 [Champsocephalus gunnari]|uniref:Uncharacterized protein n=1 Tax=Champsocephalus gunnari TaxID=52237 RepID=A0AAN8C9A9_CHAGU|nr:hypothetical protein CgunFtcFv8_015638 [Champsocephalus gunnari]
MQTWFIGLRLDLKRHKRRLVTIPPSVESNLRFWGSPENGRRGAPLGQVISYITVFTDASVTGWGGTCIE